jgi:hypothetical protein
MPRLIYAAPDDGICERDGEQQILLGNDRKKSKSKTIKQILHFVQDDKVSWI